MAAKGIHHFGILKSDLIVVCLFGCMYVGKYDLCLVFPVSKENTFCDAAIPTLEKLLRKLGKENLYVYFSAQDDELYVLIHVPENLMRKFANENKLKFIADSNALKDRAAIGWPDKGIQPVRMDIEELETKFDPFKYIFLQYDDDNFGPEEEKMFVHISRTTNHKVVDLSEADSTIFNECDRIKILQRLLEDSVHHSGLELKFVDLMKTKDSDGKPYLLDVFALHDKTLLKQLRIQINTCIHFLPFFQPLEKLRGYYGEKIALYYGFVEHFATWLLLPSFIGLGVEIIIIYYQNFVFPVVPFYSIFITLWGVGMCEFWKRREKYIALHHGMLDYEAVESDRPEFKPLKRIYLTGEEIQYYPSQYRTGRMLISFSIMFLLCCMVIGTTAGIYILRKNLASRSEAYHTAAPIVASILNAIQIQVYSFIYGFLSDFLTDFENHRTDTEYEDSMIAKNFVFYFINSFSSFIYLAFFAARQGVSIYPGMPADDPARGFEGQCGYDSCMTALALNLGIVLGVNLVVTNLVQVLLPFVNYKLKIRSQTKDAQRIITYAEKQRCRIEYTDKSLIQDYMNYSILFGYMTLFVSALPGAAFIIMISTFFDINFDRLKLFHLYRRPWPKGAEDIGTWQTIFDLLITATVVTNAALIVFTMKLVEGYSTFTQFWFFIGFQWVMFAIQFTMRHFIPDTPKEVIVQKYRQEYFNKKLILKITDDDDQEYFDKLNGNMDASRDPSIIHTNSNKERMSIFTAMITHDVPDENNQDTV